MIFDSPLPKRDATREAIADWHRRDESEVVDRLLDAARLDRKSLDRIAHRADRAARGPIPSCQW